MTYDVLVEVEWIDEDGAELDDLQEYRVSAETREEAESEALWLAAKSNPDADVSVVDDDGRANE